MAGPARQTQNQQVHYLRKTVNYNDANIATGIRFANALPAGAFMLPTYVEIETVFNAATTNVLTVGTNSSSYNDIVAAGDVDEGVTGITEVATAVGKGLTSADVDVYVKYAQSGTAATTGKATIVIPYIPNNDQ